MFHPHVTIVTPSFNQGRFIRATIDSVLSQDYPNLEYIIMDGGSTDETEAVVSEYASRLTWISEKDRGQSHAINKGFRMARGEIVAWLNSDDIILPGAVRRAVAAFERAPDAGAVYGEGYLMEVEGCLVRRFPPTQPFNLWCLLYLSDYILQQTVYFRKAVIEEVGYLDESLHYVMDWDLLIRIGKRYWMEYTPEFLGALREYADAKSFSGGRRRVRELRDMLRRHTGLRYPPGYLTYGIQAFQDYWKTRLERERASLLRVPATVLSLILYVLAASAVMLIVRRAQGWYPDRWAGDAVKWMLPVCAAGHRVRIRGSVPANQPELANQTITLSSNGRELGRARIGPGPFEALFTAPQVDSGPVTFEIRASRFTRPRLSDELSRRRLAYILHTIDYV